MEHGSGHAASFRTIRLFPEERINEVFTPAAEAVEEAIYNSLCYGASRGETGRNAGARTPGVSGRSRRNDEDDEIERGYMDGRREKHGKQGK